MLEKYDPSSDDEQSLGEFIAERTAPSKVVLAALKEIGHLAAFRLRDVIKSKEFDALSPKEQREWLKFAMEQAYGKPESMTAMLLASSRVSDLHRKDSDKLSMTKQLEQIEAEDGFEHPEMRKASTALAREAGTRGGESGGERDGGHRSAAARIEPDDDGVVRLDLHKKSMFPRKR